MCNYFTRYREPRNLQAAFKLAELPNDPPHLAPHSGANPNSRNIAAVND